MERADRADRAGLRASDFRRFIAAQFLTSVGSFLQGTALGWLVVRLTHSTFALGLVAFFSDIPAVLVTPLGGVLADRVSPHRLVWLSQAVVMLQAFALAAFLRADRLSLEAILALGFVGGIANGLYVPARQVLLGELVDGTAKLPRAVAASSVVLDAARLLGPTLGGGLIALSGEGACFLARGASLAAALALLLGMKLAPRVSAPSTASVLGSLADGARYVWSRPELRYVVLLVAAVSFTASPLAALMPYMSSVVLGRGPGSLGALGAAPGLGAIVGAAALASPHAARRLRSAVALGAGLFGLALVAFARSRTLSLSLSILVVAGFGLTLFMGACNTITLTAADRDKRGRVMSLFALSFMGTTPLGALGAGALASRIGAPDTIALGGAACAVAALAFARHASAR